MGEEDNTSQVERMLRRKGSSSSSFEEEGEAFQTPKKTRQFGVEGPGLSSSESGGELVALRKRECAPLGKEFGILGAECGAKGQEFGVMGKEFGVLGSYGGARGAKLSPEALEKCRAAGREAGVRGAAWGRFGGRPPARDEAQPGEARTEAKRALLRPEKFEPKAGHQLKALRYIREQLYAKRLGDVP